MTARPASSTADEQTALNVSRFTVELEFVQLLANPEYLKCTAL